MKTLLDLGTQPLVNTLCGSAEDALAAARFRLRATVDIDLLIRLDDESTVAPDVLYKDYVYRSGVSQPYITHCERMSEMFVGCRRGVVIDVGGNDGTLLKAFKRTMGIKTLINVDASENLREENEKHGIKYVHGFFDAEMDLPQADIITSTNVFQHTADVRKFLRAVAKHLHEDGYWLLEFPYTMRTLETLQFDQFYHEHFYYWLLTPLVKLLQEHGLNIVWAEEHPIHGGTLRLIIRKNKTPWNNFNCDNCLQQEAQFDYAVWDELVQEKITTDRRLIEELDGTVAFFGAAAKGCVYLNALQLVAGDKYLYVIDDTPGKQGKFVPGTGLPIVGREMLTTVKPDNIIILAHNFKHYIKENLQKQFDGLIISMF